ncbi:YIEGIA family protein [Paenibacillus yanchengensis]|uniref:YIEGIA family protein n=1 Tax=Paenibacillus yanchengensis TaxID=2035833 RepID=A0ABW4YK22_9BACL
MVFVSERGIYLITTFLEENKQLLAISLALLGGIVARMILLRTDYRQYPTFPHGKIIHLSLGVIAAALGSVSVPALLSKDYTAITFLTLAAQQFRDVRKMERETMTKLDSQELVSRGATYIEGIAMVFEGRNYLVIISSLVTSFFASVFSIWWGLVASVIILIIVTKLKSGKQLQHITEVKQGTVKIVGPDLYVDDIYIMNVGLKSNQHIMAEHSLGFILTPHNPNGKVTISNLGQRQAILYDLATILGVYRDSGEPALIPMAKLDIAEGRLAVFVIPKEKDVSKALQIIKQVPLLESAVRMPTEAFANEKGGVEHG